MSRWKITLIGVVQGVGFRPFIYRLARRHDLKGHVLNSGTGVTIEIEGESETMARFLASVYAELPPLARIDSETIDVLPMAGYESFNILRSRASSIKSAPVSADIALCSACLDEMLDPKNRRYRYPFINCTDCGPRYSIIRDIPYDRPHTSMDVFAMCPECENEYENPDDRRYHAEPVSCHACGPELLCLDGAKKIRTKGNDSIVLAAEAVKAGKIIAVKGMGGFHLVCDATDETAVSLLRKRKKRPAKPLAVMFPSIEAVENSAILTQNEKKLILSKERPIVIVRKQKETVMARNAAPDIDRIGVFLPYTPLHCLLLEHIGRPVIATSANLSGEPIIRDSHELLGKLGGVADLILDYNREIVNAVDDSVTQQAGSEKITLRMARGSAPKSMRLPFRIDKKILAVGANQKNSIALAFDETLILSPHIGDLNSVEACEYFERTLETFKRFYDFEPDIIVCDKHPDYATAKWAKQLADNDEQLIILEVQHHYAHLVACMAEHAIVGPVLGFAFDGTGYGDDGTIWGGEVMITDAREYKRVANIRPFRLLGGDRAVKEPRRAALSLLFEIYTFEEIAALDLPTLRQFTQQEIKALHSAWKKGVNSPLTSSVGRLFDAVASLADIVHHLGYEGESGLMMESLADDVISEVFPFTITQGEIDIRPMIRAIAAMDDKAVIVSMFFNTLVEIIFRTAGEHTDLPLLFSGGVFQNRILVEKVLKRCRQNNRVCYFQNDTPINDGGIALGQAWYGIHQAK